MYALKNGFVKKTNVSKDYLLNQSKTEVKAVFVNVIFLLKDILMNLCVMQWSSNWLEQHLYENLNLISVFNWVLVF